jgi:hypothetical protein
MHRNERRVRLEGLAFVNMALCSGVKTGGGFLRQLSKKYLLVVDDQQVPYIWSVTSYVKLLSLNNRNEYL